MEKKKEKGIKATVMTKYILEDMARNGRFYHREPWGKEKKEYYWFDFYGDNNPEYRLTNKNIRAYFSCYLEEYYGLKQASTENIYTVKQLVKAAKKNSDNYYDLHPPDKYRESQEDDFDDDGGESVLLYHVCNICGRKLEDCLCSEEKIERECNLDPDADDDE